MKNKRFFYWWDKCKAFVGGGIGLVIFKNKAIGLDITYSKLFFQWVHFSIEWTRKQDYAGLWIEFSILALDFHFKLGDTRRWDHRDDCWEEEVVLKEEEQAKAFKYEWF